MLTAEQFENVAESLARIASAAEIVVEKLVSIDESLIKLGMTDTEMGAIELIAHEIDGLTEAIKTK